MCACSLESAGGGTPKFGTYEISCMRDLDR